MTDARAERFDYLMEQLELGAASIRLGGVDDIPLALFQLAGHLAEAGAIMREVSREALDKVTPHAFVAGDNFACTICGQPEIAPIHAPGRSEVER